jgi:hypothetical protein
MATPDFSKFDKSAQPFKCEMDVGSGGMKVSSGGKLLNGLRGFGRSPERDLQTAIFAVNGITKHQVMSLSEIAQEKKVRELAAINRAQLQAALASDDKAAASALSMTQANLERRAAMHKAAARAHAVASEQSMLVAQNLETAMGRSSRGLGAIDDGRAQREALMALRTQLDSSASLTFDGKAIAGKGWVDAFRSAVRKGYDVPMPKEQMSAPRVGIGTDTDNFAAKENYVGATLQGLGKVSPRVTSGKAFDHCNRTYPTGFTAEQDKYNDLCKIERSWTGPFFEPWTEAGKLERGIPVNWQTVASAITSVIPGMGTKPPPKPAIQQAYDQTLQWGRDFDQRTLQQTGMSASTLAIGALVLGAVGIYAYRQSKGA